MQPSPEKYRTYSFEDFLQDDFFLSTISNPDTQSVDFWESCIKNGDVDRHEFLLAKKILNDVNAETEGSVTDQDLASLWHDIEETNRRGIIRKSRSNFKKMLYVGVSIAASIALLFWFSPTKDIDDKDGLMSFVESMQVDPDIDKSDVKLILSEDKAINIKDKTSEIVYDAEDITVSENKISKNETAKYNQIIVPRGKQSKLTLSDGTIMNVNAGTRVVYPSQFISEKREIFVDGEIYLEVAPDKTKPFIVRTKNISVQVLGTKFNVQAYSAEDETQVVLAEGSVKVSNDNQKDFFILKPHEMYHRSSNAEAVKKVDIIRYISWKDGLYYFDKERLDVIILKLSRYYGIKIDYDPQLADQRCSGKMDLKDNLADILIGLSFSFPIQIRQDGEKYNITLKKS